MKSTRPGDRGTFFFLSDLRGVTQLKRLVILQIIGCLLFIVIVGVLCLLGIFSPLTAIIAYIILGLGNIVNARNMLMKPIEHLSTHDKLTGVYNRIKLESKIPEYERLSDYAIIFFDVNNLKKANDIHGHHAGDKILTAAADQLRFWHKYGYLYRIGGDEFIVVITNMPETRLDSIVHEWYSTLTPLNTEYNDDFVCSLSYGIEYKTVSTSASFKTVMENADAKMYEMKKEIKRKTSKS